MRNLFCRNGCMARKREVSIELQQTEANEKHDD